MLTGKVVIKEFFIKGLCDCEMEERCRQKFLKEARSIFSLNHPNIVHILDLFEENGTAYYVMDYIEGESLADMVKRRGALPEAEAVKYVKEVGNALKYLHERRMNHLDIKPSNIMRREEDGQIILIDFGVLKQYDLVTSEGTFITPVGVSRGYSPTELYRQHGVQSFSPQSDVYALAATLFKLLTGITPPEAIEVQDEGLPIAELQAKNVSASVIAAIRLAMKGRYIRTQSIDSFLLEVGGAAGREGEISDSVPFRRPKSKLSTSIKFGLGLVVLSLVGLLMMSLGRKSLPTLFCINRQTFSVNGVKFAMVRVGGGTFMMGATSEQGRDAEGDENPIHQVTLSSFLIGETEVTQELWEAVMGSNPSTFKGIKRPVEYVNWNDCQEFIKKLNVATGRTFRLPTEAEWEYAARGGKKSRGYKYAGSNNSETVACYGKSFEEVCIGTIDVALKLPNELGLYDMSGNVEELCQDWYGYFTRSSQTNPQGAEKGQYHVVRGGYWCGGALSCRVTSRGYIDPGIRIMVVGFRLALSD